MYGESELKQRKRALVSLLPARRRDGDHKAGDAVMDGVIVSVERC